jgi:hypothetical protein
MVATAELVAVVGDVSRERFCVVADQRVVSVSGIRVVETFVALCRGLKTKHFGRHIGVGMRRTAGRGSLVAV